MPTTNEKQGEASRISWPPKSFFVQVYNLVAQIPAGKVMTYGQIAHCLGGGVSARYVGFALRAAPLDKRLPCHRVVNKKGEMAPEHVFGAGSQQRKLLEREGVAFLDDGRIDMGKCLYQR